MRTSLDQMLDVAKAFQGHIQVTKDANDKYLVSIERVWYKEGKFDIMARSIFATGDSVEQACSSFLTKAKGKILFGYDKGFFGENPPEYICI